MTLKIRSITFFVNPGHPSDASLIAQAGQAAQQARQLFTDGGYQVQTLRLATTPFSLLYADLPAKSVSPAVRSLEAQARTAGFDYIAIGPALIDHPESYALIPEIIAGTEVVFCSAEIATQAQGLSLPAIHACARIICALAPQDPNGFANLYFTALANVPAGSPFFPSAYHTEGPPGFALATESAGLAVSAFQKADNLPAGINRLKDEVRTHAERLEQTAGKVTDLTGMPFFGIDFSLAPFPTPASSLGSALEAMGVPVVGQHGSLAAAAILASALDKVAFARTGFSGLLFPQLEDSALANSAAEGILTVRDMLMYSAVCGTGLDTIPLPGSTSPEELAPLLLDLAALALRLDKPLTARLMPIPGKQAGEPTSFDFPFFANSRVLPLVSTALQPPLADAGLIPIAPREQRRN
jgi:uncharacterized protein (UPF0210 family)